MVAQSRMGGPWSRAQCVARAFRDGGHEVVLAWGGDGNCANPVAPTLEIPVPSPLGLPDAIARHVFPLASRLGLIGRKPVHSFEEVLWLIGALDERYTRSAVEVLRTHMRAARLLGVQPRCRHRRPRRGHPVRGQRRAADDRLLRFQPAQIRGNSTPAARDGNARPALVPVDP